ncbi:hypothetical protein BGW80DRAFT_1327777 [Lactifluus volemus]|nr:hypothetical protein BGW80DRAFT_1327777 [Lactifluus volemus]
MLFFKILTALLVPLAASAVPIADETNRLNHKILPMRDIVQFHGPITDFPVTCLDPSTNHNDFCRCMTAFFNSTGPPANATGSGNSRRDVSSRPWNVSGLPTQQSSILSSRDTSLDTGGKGVGCSNTCFPQSNFSIASPSLCACMVSCLLLTNVTSPSFF